MTLSPYYRDLRRRIGRDLILYPAVGGVIPDEAGRILLQSKTHEAGWFVPGGAVEPGEHPEVALVREIEEETGLIVRPLNVVLVFGGAEYRYEYPNGDRVEIIGALYRCEIVGRSSNPIDEETKSLQYFSREEMPKLRLPYPVDALFSHL
ncbi:MAG TPA: NUDIX domain-containing protein [Gammaproteobacteria bacterium]|nr:NUDIX domain-containing protein [Gammaproteobacteria bacterium]